MKRRTLAAWVCLMLQAADTCADEAWIEVRSEHFLVRSDAGQAKTLEIAEELERFRQVVGKITTTDLDVPGQDVLRVDAYASYFGFRRASSMGDALGFYAQTANGPLAVISLDEPYADLEAIGLEILRHEYTHHLLRRYSPVRYPRWYSEGFAEYLSAMELRDEVAVVGLPARRLLGTLRNTRYWLSTRDLMEAKSMYLQNSGRRLLRDPTRYRNDVWYQYAQGWLVTHFLQHAPHYRDALAGYILALNQVGVDAAAAFEQAFGVDYAEFDGIISKYWRDGELPYGIVDITEFGDLPQPEVRALGPLEVDAVAHETRVRLGELTGRELRQARRALTALLHAGIRTRETRTLLGDLALLAGDHDAARIQADALLAADPNDAVGATLRGRLLLESASAESLPADHIQQARQWFERATQGDPNYVPALLGKVAVDLLPGQVVREDSFDALNTALANRPGLSEAEEQRVRLVAKAGRIDQARELARTLLEWAPDNEEQRRLRQLLNELESER